jgi:hypothetical protein
MFSYYTRYYVSPPVDQYLKFKNHCSLLYSMETTIFLFIYPFINIPQNKQEMEVLPASVSDPNWFKYWSGYSLT